MYLRRSGIVFAAVMSSSLLVDLAVAGSSGAATPDGSGDERRHDARLGAGVECPVGSRR
jgi:hypothetical protein